MRPTWIIYGLLFAVLGCKQQSPIAVVSEGDDSQLIEMKAVDTSASRLLSEPGVDSSGGSNENYFGRLAISSIRYEFPQASDSLLLAEAIFLDESRPMEHDGQVVAYHSFDAGAVVLNSDTLS